MTYAVYSVFSTVCTAMEGNHHKILDILDKLREDDFKRFKLFLIHGIREDIPRIPTAKLENADVTKTVQEMERYFQHGDIVEIAKEIFQKMGLHRLVRLLSSTESNNEEDETAR